MASSGCISLFNPFAKNMAAKAELAIKTKGKTEEQKKCISFFYFSENSGCFSKKSPITFDQYKQMVFTKIKNLNLRARALAKIGLDESQICEIAPIPLSGFVFDRDTRDNRAYQNGEAVSSQFSVTWLFFSYNQLYVYNYTFDMTSDDSWEMVKEIFYRDITSVTTETDIEERIYSTFSGCTKKEVVDKNNAVFEYLKIVVPNDSMSYSMKSTPNIVRSLMGAKQFIREKKM